MININKVKYMMYGNCIEITNGDVLVRVTTDVGPRIIYYGTIDEDNMMFCDVDDNVNRSNDYLDVNFKKGEAWHIYGGHRLWTSPEDEASYFPDNYPVEVKMLDNGAVFYSANECTTGIRKGISVTMRESGELTLDHTFYNFTDNTVTYALWALSVMNKGGLAVIPMATDDTGLLANRNIVLWPYTNVKDDRLTIQQTYLSLQQKEVCDGSLKIGVLNTEGTVYFIRNGKMLEKKFDKADRLGNYVDFSCSTELYTSEHIIEVEALSQLVDIHAGDTAHHVEKWIMHQNDDLQKKVMEMINED